MPPAEAERVRAVFAGYVNRREAFSMLENHNLHKAGHIIMLESSGMPVLGPEGALLGFRGSDRDVTARKDAERALQESSFFLRETQRVGRIGGWKVNPERNLVMWTDGVFSLVDEPLHYRPDLAMAMLYYPPEWRMPLTELLWHTYRTGEPFVYQCELRSRTGAEIWVELRGSPGIVDDRIDHVVGTIQDITPHREAMKALHDAKERAEEANLAKSRFLASMSHELRTPLNAIIGFAELLSRADLTAKHKKFVEIMSQAGKSLLQVIQDILDLTKIEVGKVVTHVTEFDLYDELNAVISQFELEAQTKKLSLTLHIAPEVPRRVRGDDGLLRQVLVNLIGNAFKFTLEGDVEITVMRHREPNIKEEEPPLIVFNVRDTGIGIKPENQSRIFEMFEQEESSMTRRFGGSGLGLTISRKLVTLLGGQIWLVSEAGVGSCFSFTARLEQAETPATQPAPQLHEPLIIAPERRLVLVVEDDSFSRLLTAEVLEQHGYQTKTANDGASALELLQQIPFDLVLMDIQLPVLNGAEATRRIRSGEVPGCRPDLPIIAVTAYALAGDREKFLAMGMDDYIQKPIDIDTVLATLQRFL